MIVIAKLAPAISRFSGMHWLTSLVDRKRLGFGSASCTIPQLSHLASREDLFMLALPIKMVLRWMVNLKYLIHIDEYFLNF